MKRPHLHLPHFNFRRVDRLDVQMGVELAIGAILVALLIRFAAP